MYIELRIVPGERVIVARLNYTVHLEGIEGQE